MNKVILITSLLVIFSLSLLLINKDNTFQMSAKEETAKEETAKEETAKNETAKNETAKEETREETPKNCINRDWKIDESRNI